jgi:hypothetical protein
MEAVLRQDAALPWRYVPLDVLVLAPLSALTVGALAAPLVGLRLAAAGVYEAPGAVVQIARIVSRTSKLGALGKAVMLPLCAVLPLVGMVAAPVWGVLAGFLHGVVIGWTALAHKAPFDVLTWPVAATVGGFDGLVSGTRSMIEMDDDAGFIPVDIVILAPLGALLGGALGAPIMAANLLGLSVCPRGLASALLLVSTTNKLGPFAKALSQGVLVLGFTLVLPPLALLAGALMGLGHGASVGWQFFAARGHYDIVTYPTALWRESVLEPISAYVESLRARDAATPRPEVVIDVNPLLLLTASVVGLLGAVITSLVYLTLGLLFLLPMTYHMYRVNSKMCGSDFKIAEALLACSGYMLQMVLIPVYAATLTAWQPIEGLGVGFARVAYSVIFHSNASEMGGGCGCLLNTLGFTGLVPAIKKLGADIGQRWQDGEKPVMRVFNRLSRAQEDLCHCFSKRARASSRADDSYRSDPEDPDSPDPRRSSHSPPARLSAAGRAGAAGAAGDRTPAAGVETRGQHQRLHDEEEAVIAD